jgi:hypothetical protein
MALPQQDIDLGVLSHFAHRSWHKQPLVVELPVFAAVAANLLAATFGAVVLRSKPVAMFTVNTPA